MNFVNYKSFHKILDKDRVKEFTGPYKDITTNRLETFFGHEFYDVNSLSTKSIYVRLSRF